MRLGVNTHFAQGYNQNEIATAASLGAAIIRDGGSKVTSPAGSPPVSNDFIGKAAAAGLDDTTVFCGTKALFGTQKLPTTDAERQAFADNIVTQLNLHPGQIQEIEVWNELNANNTNLPAGADLAQTYTDLLKTVWQTVKPLFPDVKILGDSVNVIATGLIDQTLKDGAANYMDGIVIHPYQPSPENLGKEIEHLQSVMAANGKVLPVYATEFGSSFASADDVPAYLLKAATEMASVHVAEADWYGLQDEAAYQNIGLLDMKGNLKPGAATFSFLAKELLPLGDPVRIDTGNDITRVYRYGADTYVIWGDTRSISFGQGGTFYDDMGHQIAAPTSIGDAPIIVKGTTFTLGAEQVFADSLLQFGDSNWSYLAQSGTSTPVATHMRDWNWNSYYTAIDPNVLSITQNGVTPAEGGNATSINAIERYTATTSHRAEVTGTWTPSSGSTNGIDLHVLLDGKEIYSTIVTSTFTLSGLYVDLNPGDTLDFVVGTNGSWVGDSTKARIQLVDASPSTAGSGGTPIHAAPTVGTAGADTLRAGDAGSTLQGLAGDDTLTGGAGDDILMGGSGKNRLDGGGGTNTVSYADAASAIQVDLNVTGFQKIASGTRDSLVALNNVIGSSFNDRITGNAADNQLHGGAGDDTLMASGGSDLLDGGSGTDTASWASVMHGVVLDLTRADAQGVGGTDIIRLQDIENLIGSNFDDQFTGDARDNLLQGGGGNDVLDGGLGNDRLDGGSGVNTASYASATGGVRVSLASSAQDTGAAGTDTLVSIQNLLGSAYDDVLTGDKYANRLEGGLGNDRLVGGRGGDTLIGGAGADTFVLTQASDSKRTAPDTILDFNGSEGDRIDLSAIDAKPKTGGDQAFSIVSAFGRHPGELVLGHSSDGWLVQGDVNGDGTADFTLNVHAATLSAGDFIL